MLVFDFVYIIHPERYFARRVNACFVLAVYGKEAVVFPDDTAVGCKLHQATAAVAAHGAFSAIGIIIFHFKIITWMAVQQHQAVGTDTKATVAKKTYLFPGKIVFAAPVVKDNKIITGALVFDKMNVHSYEALTVCSVC
jgi:hypothetical protein